MISYTKFFSLPCLLAVILIGSSTASLFASKKDDEKAGALLFRDKGCAYCHGVGGVGGKKAPSLVGLPKDKAWPTDKITNQILNGGQKMPPFRESLTDDEVAQLVAYLRAKSKPIPPPTSGQDSAPPPAPGLGIRRDTATAQLVGHSTRVNLVDVSQRALAMAGS